MNVKVIAVLSASAGFVAGLAVGYFATKSRVEEIERKHYDKVFQEELRRTKAIYKIDVEKPGKSDNIPIKRDRSEAERINYSSVVSEYVTDEELEDLEEASESPYPKTYEEREERLADMKAKRQAPQKEDLTLSWSVTIPEEEFIENILDYDQEFWTFYKGDEVMAGSDDSVIRNWQDYVDSALIEAVSYESETDVLHIRNEQREIDYEITFHEGKYSVVVASEEFEKDEKSSPKVLKFRREDE